MVELQLVIRVEYSTSSRLSYGRGYVYDLRYHLVWCTKYRKPVLTDDVEAALQKDIRETARSLGVKIIALECMPDHVHILVECTPQHFIPTIIKILKGNAARHLFIAYPELKLQLWGGHLWNPSYFVATVSDRTAKQVEEYINKQKVRL